MRIDLKKLKQNLTIEDVEMIVEKLDIPITSKNVNIWSLKGGCHNPNCNCDSNLKLYVNSLTFTCFSHNCLNGNDVLDLITKRKQLTNPSWNFNNTINFIIDTLGLDIVKISEKRTKKTFNYKGFFNRYLNKESESSNIEIYDDEILQYFRNNIYHSNFYDEGISIETMDKFEIGWYKYKQQITIPVRDVDGNLIGIRVRNTDPEVEKDKKYIPLNVGDMWYNFPSSNTLYGVCQNKLNIQKHKKVILFEGEKSVLKMENYGDNISLALFGTNFGTKQRQLLLDLGVEDVYIALDKQYTQYGDTEYQVYLDKVNKIKSKLIGYFKIHIIEDRDDLLGYKDSPIDKGIEIFEKLK